MLVFIFKSIHIIEVNPMRKCEFTRIKQKMNINLKNVRFEKTKLKFQNHYDSLAFVRSDLLSFSWFNCILLFLYCVLGERVWVSQSFIKKLRANSPAVTLPWWQKFNFIEINETKNRVVFRNQIVFLQSKISIWKHYLAAVNKSKWSDRTRTKKK